MSAIVAAADRLEDRRIDAVLGRAFTAGDRLRAMQVAAGDVLVDASNVAGAGRVVEGRPVKIRACSVAGCGGWVDGVGWHIKTTRKGWGPTRLGGAWVWSTVAHDPRPCAWPRPFARGATP